MTKMRLKKKGFENTLFRRVSTVEGVLGEGRAFAGGAAVFPCCPAAPAKNLTTVDGGCMRAAGGADLLFRLFAVCVCVCVCVCGRMHVMHAITGCTG